MKQLLSLAFVATSLCFLTIAQPLAAIDDDVSASTPTSSVTPAILNAEIKEVESSAGLSDEAKSKLIELYRKALSNLEATAANSANANAFAEARRNAPTQVQVIREEIEKSKLTDPLDTLGVNFETPLEQIERQRSKEQADQAAVTARRTDFERRLAVEENRPAAIRERLAEATQQQSEIAALRQAPPEADAGPALIQARRWVLDTSDRARSTEINMLDQELLSQPMRVELLEAKLERATQSVGRIDIRVRALSELVTRKRQREAEQAKMAAEETRRETEGENPLLVRLAEQNAALTEELHAMTSQLDTLNQEREIAQRRAKRIEADFADAQAMLQTNLLPEGLGQLLLRHRESLPDFKLYNRRARAREEAIVEVGVRRLHHREEARRIADLDETVVELEATTSTETTPWLRDNVRELVVQRQELLEKALEHNEFYLRELRELDATERKLLNSATAYNDFLNEHLFWLRTGDPVDIQDVKGLPEEVRLLASSAQWSVLGGSFKSQATQSPVFWLTLVLAAALVWKRRSLISAIESTAKPVGKPTHDSLKYTMHAFMLTLIVAAPLPLVVAAIGWQLLAAAQGAGLSHGVGVTLIRVAIDFFIMRTLVIACIPRGLAAAHFRWPESGVRQLRVELARLSWIYLPMGLIVLLAADFNPVASGGIIALLGVFVFYTALTFFFFRLLHPKRGVLVLLRGRLQTVKFSRAFSVWLTLLLAFVLGMAILSLTGYVFSVSILLHLFLSTLEMIAGLIVFHALALRWLRVTRRRLAYEEAVERRKAERAAKQAQASKSESEESAALDVEEPEVNLEALTDDTEELAKIVTIVTGLIGLYVIWSPLLPALRIFEDVTLWHHTVTVDGEDKRLPITLAHAGLALVYAAGTAVLAKRLPAMLEIILLQHFDMEAGSRYTITTLTNYVIIALGILLVLNTIGAQWSQLQWLVAALGVGIGFGLQEIVANFISGLIILFERPVRVGDVVTVGDTSGVVTRIRIRATTIRNWDRKELLVPNKEFITGRVLNWTLSDELTRVQITVGVAYGTDVDKALALMTEAAEEHERILDDPAPLLSFESFGDNALTLVLRAYLGSLDHRLRTITELHKAINNKFNEAGIVIAFPQRDLHLDTQGPLRVSIENTHNKVT